MVGIIASQAVDMQGYLRMVDETLEEFVQQVDIKVTDAGPWIVGMVFEAGTSREIDNHA